MITNDLIQYIENEVARGVTHEAIQQALVNANWKAIEVADALRIVTERAHTKTTGKQYVPPVFPTARAIAPTMTPTNPTTPISPTAPTAQTINQSAVQDTLNHPQSPTEQKPVASNLSAGSFIPKLSTFDTPNDGPIISESTPKKIDHHKLIPLLVLFGIVVVAGAGYFFIKPFLNDPSKKIANIVGVTEKARGIQYSGEYEITAPAGIVFTDKMLTSNYGGTSARQSVANIKGSFFGVDDWFDYRAKKNEVKFTTSIGIPGTSSLEFTTTSRLINNALYAKLSDSTAIFDSAVSGQGANWVRYDQGDQVPAFAYGFWGGDSLYANGFPREISQYLSQSIVGDYQQLPTGDTVANVKLSENIVNYFSSIFMTGDKLGESASIGSKYEVSALTEIPTGDITLNPSGVIKKVVIAFGYKTKEYTVPIHVRFTLSFDRFDNPPAINIPSLVVPYGDLVGTAQPSDVPQSLQGFFADVRTIASVYKASAVHSYRGVCITKGDTTLESSELAIPNISSKVVSSGYELPVCADTDTAWSYYTRNNTGYYCTDSRGFSGKVDRQPLGDKCS